MPSKGDSRRCSVVKVLWSLPVAKSGRTQDLYDGFSAPTFRARLEKLWEQKPTMEVRRGGDWGWLFDVVWIYWINDCTVPESELVDTCTLLRITTCWRRWWKTIVKHGKTASRIHFLAWYFQVSSILIWPFGSKVPDWIYFFRCTGPPGGQFFFGVYWSPVSRQEIPGGAAKALPDRAKCGAAKAGSLRTIGIKWRQKMATATTIGPKLQGH